MRDKGVTSVCLANEIGVSKVTISNLINNKTSPSLETLEKIADALEVPMWELFSSREDISSDELTALIECKGVFYKATTISELENIISNIKASL